VLATAVNVLEARGMIVCAVAMKDPSVGGDNIAARKTPQCPALKNLRGNTRLFVGHSFRRDLRPAIHAASEFAEKVAMAVLPSGARNPSMLNAQEKRDSSAEFMSWAVGQKKA
jgi:hypothetical protein